MSETDYQMIDSRLIRRVIEDISVTLPVMIGYKYGTDVNGKVTNLRERGILPSCSWICKDTKILKRYPNGVFVGSFSTKLSKCNLKALINDPDVVHVGLDPDYREILTDSAFETNKNSNGFEPNG